MPQPHNNFPAALEDAMIQLLASADAALPADAKANLRPSKSDDPNLFPRVAVHVANGEEAIYQSGIYTCPLTIRCHTDIDDGTTQFSAQKRAAAEALFGRVLDVIQWTTLKAELDATGKVFIHGFGSPSLSHTQIGEREWIDEVTLDVVGFALTS
jgi:hypothetical protein